MEVEVVCLERCRRGALYTYCLSLVTIITLPVYYYCYERRHTKKKSYSGMTPITNKMPEPPDHDQTITGVWYVSSLASEGIKPAKKKNRVLGPRSGRIGSSCPEPSGPTGLDRGDYEGKVYAPPALSN